nr:MAG TPA: Large polyvalent protein associated domain 23 [Caudoviricetes sp.]
MAQKLDRSYFGTGNRKTATGTNKKDTSGAAETVQKLNRSHFNKPESAPAAGASPQKKPAPAAGAFPQKKIAPATAPSKKQGGTQTPRQSQFGSNAQTSAGFQRDIDDLNAKALAISREKDKLSSLKDFAKNSKKIADLSKQSFELSKQIADLEKKRDAKKAEEDQALIDSGEYRKANLKDIFVNSAKQGYYNSLYGAESYKSMSGRKNDKEKYANILDSDDYKFVPQGKIASAISGAAGLLGQQVYQTTNPTALAMGATAAAGAAIAGQAGPQVLVPEEVLTVPSAFVTGLKIASAEKNYEIEAGLAYNEMLENGVSEKTARNVAAIVGGVNAGLEALQLDELAKSVQILKNNPLTGEASKRLSQYLIEKGLSLGNETLQEVLQEGSTITGAQIANKIDKGEWAYSGGEVADRLKDTAISSALSFGIAGLPSTAIDSTNIYRAGKRSQQLAQQGVQERADVQEGTRTTPAQMNAQTQQEGAQRAIQEAVQRQTVSNPVSMEEQVLRQREAAVQKTFTGIADKLGDNGRKAFQTAYQGTDRGDYAGEFLRAYHAGMTNQKNPNSTSAVSFAAYAAGQNDAAASLAREKRAAQFAKTAGTDSGLVFDDYVSREMDSAVADEVNTVSKALGVRTRMVDQVLGGSANGQITGSDVLIAKDAVDPALQVVGHEWTHRVQELAPEQYRSFRDAVTSIPDVQEAAQILLEQYNRAGVETSYEQALDEATANYAGDMIANSDVLDDFIWKHSADRTLLQKLRDAIHEIVGKLTGRAKRQAQTVEGKLQAAFEAASKQAESLNSKNTATEDGETRYSFAGEKAKNADLEALRTAQEMEKDGADTETIRQKTGWFRGADGKWRWEIDDSGMEFRRDGDAQLLNEPEYRRLQELTDKWAKSFEEDGTPLSASEEAEMTELQKKYSDMVWDEKYLLRDFLKHDKLFKEYPYLNRVSLVFDELGAGENGYFDKRSNTIVLSDNLIGTTENTLIHEIQHVIQKIEGFANGSSPKYWNERMENGYSKRWASGEEMMPSELYRNTAGEIEARDAAARRSLTVEERKNRKPNTGDENTVFADSGMSYEFVGKNKDGIEVYKTGENVKKMSYRERMEAFLDIMRNEYAGRTAKFNDGNNTYYASFDEADLRKNVYGDKKSSPKGWKAKINTGADGSIFELVENAAYNGSKAEQGKKTQAHQNLSGWDYFVKTVQIDGQVYDLLANVRKKPDGEFVYSIQLNENKNKASAPPLQYQNGTAKANNRPVGVSTNASDDSVSQSKDNVNGNLSFGEGSGKTAMQEAFEKAKEKTRYSLKDYSDAEQRDHRKKAIAFFGKTYNWNETGYLTPAGTKLDFSGRHEGGPGGYRTVDHRDIRDAIGEDYGGDDYSGSMVQFMSEGNIRISPESGGINLSVEPTKSQMDALSDFIGKNRGEVILDLDTPDGQTVSSTEYPRGTHSSKVLNDIKAYFKDGTTPHVSEMSQFLSLKGTENAQEIAALKRENESLKERVEYWKGQTRRSQGVTTDRKSVQKAADALVKDYGAEISGSDITGDLQSLYDYIASGKDGRDELTYAEARRRSDAIAERIAESAVEVDDRAYKEYAGLRKYLKNTKLTLTEADAAEITDFNEFRKSLFGKLKISKGEHTNVDQIYSELSSQYPEFFNEAQETNISDQVQRIADVANRLYKVTEYNPFEGYMGQAVASISNDIMDRFFDLPQTKKTFADRAAEQVRDARLTGRFAADEARAAGKKAAGDAFLAGQMAQGRQDAKHLRTAQEAAQRAQDSARSALERERTRRTEQVQDARAKGRQAANDAFLAGQISQGKRDAKRLRSTAQALAKERTRRAEQVQALKERYREKDVTRRDNQKRRELRAKIVRHASALSQKLLRPTDNQHIPEDMRSAVAKVLESINQESSPNARSFTLDPVTKERIYKDPGTPTNRTVAFQNLKEQYQKIAQDGDMVVDPSLLGGDDVAGGFSEVIKMGDTRLTDLTTEQLKTMWNVLKSVEHSVTTAGKTLASEKFETTKQFADALRMDGMTRRRKLGNNVAISLETPYTFFAHFGQTGKDIYRMLRNAQDHQEIMARDVAEKVHQILGDAKTGIRGNAVTSMNEEVHHFTTTEGHELDLTTAQAMELYLLSERKQAEDHLLKGGIVQPEIKIPGKTKIPRGTDVIHLSAEDIQSIVKVLTPEQIRIADGLQKLTTGVLANYGNEASMKAYGYKKFTEQDYWPIKSAKEALHSSQEKDSGNVRSIKNIGMAQAVKPNAATPLNIRGVFDTFADHASDMIDYAAWLCPMEDANRLYNFQFRDSEGNLVQTVKGFLDEKGGEGSQKYWQKLMGDIQNGIEAKDFEPLTGLFKKPIGSFKAAAVGANLRVVIQQPTAFFRASAVLDPADMARGLTGGVTKGNGWEKALTHSPIAMRKDVGSFDISSPYTLNDRFYGKEGIANKINDKAGALAGKADAVTWGALWNACEWQVKRERPNLRAGSGEFYSAVNEVFTNMIDQTQVVDGILQRSNIMRGHSDLAKQATSFMGEPIMSLNVFMRAWDNMRYEENPAKRSKAIKTVGRAAAALLVTDVVNAIAQSIMDANRDDDPDKDYWEKFWTAFWGLTGDEENTLQRLRSVVIGGNLGSNIDKVGGIPFAKDILSIISGYSVARTDMEVAEDIINASKSFIDSMGDNGKKTRAEALSNVIAAGAKIAGLPVSNLKRELVTTVRTAIQATGNVAIEYEYEKLFYNIYSTSNKDRYMGLAFKALEQGDLTTYEHIRKELKDFMALDSTSVDSGMQNRLEKKQEKDGDYRLPQNAASLIGAKDSYDDSEGEDKFTENDLSSDDYIVYSRRKSELYNSIESGLKGSQTFQNFTGKQKDKALSSAETYAKKTALHETDKTYKITDKWVLNAQEAQKKYNISPWVYVALKTQVSDLESVKDRNGDTIPNSKGLLIMQAVYNMPGLHEYQKEALFKYLGVGKSIQHLNKARVAERIQQNVRIAGK